MPILNVIEIAHHETRCPSPAELQVLHERGHSSPGQERVFENQGFLVVLAGVGFFLAGVEVAETMGVCLFDFIILTAAPAFRRPPVTDKVS